MLWQSLLRQKHFCMSTYFWRRETCVITSVINILLQCAVHLNFLCFIDCLCIHCKLCKMISKREKIATVIIVIGVLSAKKKKQKKPRSVWERKWIQRRKLHGACNALSRELRIEDSSQLKNVMEMFAINICIQNN